MNLEELKSWMKESVFVDMVNSETDESGNTYHDKIYRNNDKLYMVSFQNGRPYQDWNAIDGKWIKGQYTPTEVVGRIVEVIEYISVEEFKELNAVNPEPPFSIEDEPAPF